MTYASSELYHLNWIFCGDPWIHFWNGIGAGLVQTFLTLWNGTCMYFCRNPWIPWNGTYVFSYLTIVERFFSLKFPKVQGGHGQPNQKLHLDS